MHLSNQSKQYAELSITLDQNPIKVVTDAKFLGVVVDRTLSYKNHVNYLKTNCLIALGIFKVVVHTDWGTGRKTLLCRYRTLVRHQLDYGCIVYGAASKPLLRKLEPSRHQGL